MRGVPDESYGPAASPRNGTECQTGIIQFHVHLIHLAQLNARTRLRFDGEDDEHGFRFDRNVLF